MIAASLSRSIWAARHQQQKVLAKANRNRDLPQVELTDEEWEILRRADKMARAMREAEAGTK